MSLIRNDILKKKQDKIIELIQSGESYQALEQAQIVVRKMKKINRLQEALIFLMRMAMVFMTRLEWHSAVVCANRSISQFPSNSTTIMKVLQDLYFQFAHSVTDDSVCPELFDFFDKLSKYFPQHIEDFLTIQAKLADKANYYYHAQTFYTSLISRCLKADTQESKEKTDRIIETLGPLLWRWVLYEKDEKQRKITSQFIFCRCIMDILKMKGTFDIAENFIEIIKTTVPNGLNGNDYFNMPLFHFTEFYMKAIELKSAKTADFLVRKYNRLLNADSELLDSISKVKSVQIVGTNNLESMFQNFIGEMFGGGSGGR